MKFCLKTKKFNRFDFENFKSFCQKETKPDMTNSRIGLPEFIFYTNLIINLYKRAAVESELFSEVSAIYDTGAVGKGFDIKFKNQTKDIQYTISDNVLCIVLTIKFENEQYLEICYKLLCENSKDYPVKIELHPWGIDIFSKHKILFNSKLYMNIYDDLSSDRSIKNQNKIKRKLIKQYKKFINNCFFEINNIVKNLLDKICLLPVRI